MKPEALEKARERIIVRNKTHPISSELARLNYLKVKKRLGYSPINPVGAAHYRWKGGFKITHEGYRKIIAHTHPLADEKGYVLEHVFVMGSLIKRHIKPGEEVHHLDGNKLNNSPSNLRLFKTKAEHVKFHWDTNWKNRRVAH